MLYYDFQNYEEFKEIFGIVEHGNGVKSRKNRILLSAYKDRELLRRHRASREVKGLIGMRDHFLRRYSRIQNRVRKDAGKNQSRVREIALWYDKICDSRYFRRLATDDLVAADNVPEAKCVMYRILRDPYYSDENAPWNLNLMGKTFYSDKYETDDMNGLCEDGTLNAIRYRSVEKDRVFKMRAGKMFGNIWDCNVITRKMPEQILRWMGEEFVADWVEYAREHLCNEGFTLHVDDNFHDIYTRSCCKGYDTDSDSFGSCMVGDGQWTFYRDAVKAKAAYLKDEDGMIVARCILFTEVKDEEGRVWRLAERQYSFQCDESLKRQLVTALIRGGHIDGYKRVGSSCHDGRDFVDNEGNSLSDKMFSIECNLETGDTLSYQDSFKSYNLDEHVATNYGAGIYDLATTSSRFEKDDDDDDENHDDECWSQYNSEWIPQDDAYYVDTRDDYFYSEQVVYANRWNGNRFYEEDCFIDDCLEIGGDYYYAGWRAEDPADNGLIRCEKCGEWFPTGEGCYSSLLEKEFCDDDCMEAAENDWHVDQGDVWSDWDDEWLNADDAIEVYEWIKGTKYTPGYYSLGTICIDSFNSLVEDGRAAEFGGDYFIDEIMYDGEPAHVGQFRKAA